MHQNKLSNLFVEVDLDFYLDPSVDMNFPVIKFKQTTNTFTNVMHIENLFDMDLGLL